MWSEKIKTLIEEHMVGSQVNVVGGEGKFDVTVISDAFAGLRAVKKQQLVYAALNEHIANGSIHAVTIRTYTPAEWDSRD